MTKMTLLNADLPCPEPETVEIPDTLADDFARAEYICYDPCWDMDEYAG